MIVSPDQARLLMEALLRAVHLDYGRLVLQAQDGKLVHVNVEHSVKPDALADVCSPVEIQERAS